MSKKDLTTALKNLAASVGEIRSEYQSEEDRHSDVIASVFVRLSLVIAQGASLVESSGADWREWAIRQAAGFGKRDDDGTFGNPAPTTVYRYRNAGAIAGMVESIPEGTSYLALVPFYRLYAAATTDEGREKAAATIRSEWAKLAAKGAPTVEKATATVERLQARGTRGKQGADAAGRKAKQDAKNTRSRNTPTTTTETDDNTVSVDPAALESLGKTVAAFVRKAAKDHNIPAEAVQSIMLGTLRLAKEHGVSLVIGSLAVK